MGKELTDWVLNQVQPRGKAASLRQLALSAGLSQSALNTILERGRAEPETLLKLGRATNTSPVQLFLMAGWLTYEDLEGVPIPELSAEEVGWLRMLRETRPDLRRPILAGVQAAWEQSREPVQSEFVAEPQSSPLEDLG